MKSLQPEPLTPCIEPGPPSRFTLDGSDELEHHLHRICAWVQEGVLGVVPPERIEALLLGGGYGRGEGGVLKTPAGDRPYNDLEFYVLVRGNGWRNGRRYEPAIQPLAERLSENAGVEVEFKILSLARLESRPVSMFDYDLVMGHRWLWGEERLLAGCGHHRAAANIPLSEAARLLLNRCSGLLFAAEQLQAQPFTAENADFIGRNLAKAQLAFGDAVLTVFGRYHWSCRERQRRLSCLDTLDEMPWFPEVRRDYDAAVEFKLHPHRARPRVADLRNGHRRVTAQALQVWLWLESRRLARPFVHARDYALGPGNRFPEAPRWRNLALNLRTFGPAILGKPGAGRHPRERLARALALLLWESDAVNERPILSCLQRELGTSATNWLDLVAAYRRLWRRFR